MTGAASCDVTTWPDAISYLGFFVMVCVIVWLVRRKRG